MHLLGRYALHCSSNYLKAETISGVYATAHIPHAFAFSTFWGVRVQICMQHFHIDRLGGSKKSDTNQGKQDYIVELVRQAVNGKEAAEWLCFSELGRLRGEQAGGSN